MEIAAGNDLEPNDENALIVENVEVQDEANLDDIIVISSANSPLRPISVSPSTKKRKISTPEKRSNRDEEDDGAMCAICMDYFVSAGDHRIVSLKCGHIFGESCIRRWLVEGGANKSCPQCKTKATNRDLRFIYATKVKVLDNDREMELQMKLKILEGEKASLLTENMVDKMRIASLNREKRLLEEQIDILKHSVQNSTGRATAGIRSIKTGRIYLEKNLDFRENLDSRLIKYLCRNKKLIITQKSAEGSLFPGFGVKLCDLSNLPNYRLEKFINTGNKVVNDFSTDVSEAFVITASRETTCKTYSLHSNSSVNSFTPSTVPIWSCSFDRDRLNVLYLGAQNGVTYIYDTRMPNQVWKEVSDVNNRAPVKYTIPMKPTETFPNGGFFVVHTRGLYFYEYVTSAEISSTTLNFNEPIHDASYDDRTEMLLITKSPTGEGIEFSQTKHFLMKLSKEEGVPVLQEIFSFNGCSSKLPSNSRPSQIKVPDGFIVANYLSDTKMLQVRSPSNNVLHQISATDHISDVCPIYVDNSIYFGALSTSRCRLFRVNLEY